MRSVLGSVRLSEGRLFVVVDVAALLVVVFQAQKVSDDLLQKIGSKNRRALDLVAAKCYYYHARVYEFLNKFDTMRRYKHTLAIFQ